MFPHLWGELKYRQKMLTDPKFHLKQKIKHPGFLFNYEQPMNHESNQGINRISLGNNNHTGISPTNTNESNGFSPVNDPLKQQVDAEMKFASYQFHQGMDVLKHGEPQTAADYQNQMAVLHGPLQAPGHNPMSLFNQGCMAPGM